MVQIPVLPLPTPWWDVVHGVYCDEFAEFQLKDMPARQVMGSFIPSSGVGTGYTRAAMENMATSAGNRVFEPECLTEDYENGMRLHALGCSQAFVPLRANARRAVITREYFPRTLRAAIRQRTRWITGIALQSWERHGWNGNAADVYWFWRDRKGLLGNPLSLASNLVFLYGAATSLWAPVARLTHLLDRRVAVATLALLIYRTAIRIFCVGRMYGWVFAAGAPLRCVCANFINSVAGMRALVQFARAKILREPLVWLKTDHGYPSRAALLEHKRTLADILTSSGYLDQHRLRKALDMKPADMNLGDYLVSQHVLSAEQLLHALSLQHGLPAGPVLPEEVSPAAARTLPRHVVRSWRVLPYRIVAGSLHVATPDTPSDEMTRELRGFTALEMRFQLVTSENFERLLELLQ
jgi:adsorption protein B